MTKHVLFIHGACDDGLEADRQLAASLANALGNGYKVHYLEMPQDETTAPFGSQWPEQIGREIAKIPGKIILVGHSLGASMLLKYLSENDP